MISAVALVAIQGTTTTGAADQGSGDQNPSTPVSVDQNPELVDQTPAENEEQNDAPATTTISAKKTADGFWEKTILYTWTIDKTVYENDYVVLADDCNGYDLMIEPGESAVISYLITADRSCPVVTEKIGVKGTITVTNTGCADTQSLTIVDTIQILVDDCVGYEDYVSFAVDTSSHPILAAGESYCYSYCFEFDAVTGACYRNGADVTICNFEGHAGEMYGVEAMDGFNLPCEPKVTIIDDNACIVDKIGAIPSGFCVEALTGIGPWFVNGDKCSHFEVSVNLKVTNVHACRDKIYTICNTAILNLEDSCGEISDSEPIVIYGGYLETTLGICKTADVSWTEYIQLGLDFPDAALASQLSQEDVEFANSADPVIIDQIVLSDVGTFTVVGGITVINTGAYATQGLVLTDTIQMWNGECWIDVATINVDTCAKPILCPGESYTYAYEVTFTLENVAFIDFDETPLQNVAYASICNYDDDAEVDGVYFYLPLKVPFLPTMLTMETSVVYGASTIAPLSDDCNGPQMEFATELNYHQIVQVVFGEETTISTMTDITAVTTVTYTNQCDSVSKELKTAIYNEGTTKILGDEKCGKIGFQTVTHDDECMTICLNGQEVEVEMRGLLAACNQVSVCIGDDGFAITNDQMLFYGAYACFVVAEGQIPA